MNEITVPFAYDKGYQEARGHDAAVADNYVRHTLIGDPLLDPVLAEIADLPTPELHRFVGAGIERDEDELRKAPKALRDFFEQVNTPPPWCNYKDFEPAARVFYTEVNNMLVAFVCGVLIEGFTTLIAKSFNITGRVTRGPGDRRLRQNNRHLMEIFFPGGMERDGEGWKTTMRIRFVHGQVRRLMEPCQDWHKDSWGVPVSAAHLGLASVVFSLRLLQHSTLIGAQYTSEQEESVMRLWRYTGYLMGVPESILFTNREEAAHLLDIGLMCEPAPTLDSVIMANSLIDAIPVVANIESPREARAVKSLAYGIGRSLLGHEMADQLRFPKKGKVTSLYKWKFLQAIDRMRRDKKSIKAENFAQVLDISQYDDVGLSYKLPDHVYSLKSGDW